MQQDRADTTHQLVRTDTRLSGNYSLYVGGGRAYIHTLNKSSFSQRMDKLDVSGNGSFARDLGSFFNQATDPAAAAFPEEGDSAATELSDQFDTSAWSGVRASGGRTSFFAPLWINDEASMPDKFVLYRKEGPVDKAAVSKNSSLGMANFSNEVIRDSELVGVYDMGEGSTVGQYIRAHARAGNFTDSPVRLVGNARPFLEFNGISINSGGFMTYSDNGNILEEYKTARDFEQSIADEWGERGLVVANLINMSFEFEPGDDENFYRYFGFYVQDRWSDVELQADPYQCFGYSGRNVLVEDEVQDSYVMLMESPEYNRQTDGTYSSDTPNDRSAGDPTGKLYLGLLDVGGKYVSYYTDGSAKNANLEHLARTNLETKKYVNLPSPMDRDAFFERMQVKFDRGNRIIRSPLGAFHGDLQGKYITVPNTGSATEYWMQPKITEVISKYEAVISPEMRGTVGDYDRTYDVVVSREIRHGHINPIPYRDFETSLFTRQNGNFEITYPETALPERLGATAGEYWTSNNVYDANKEQDLVGEEYGLMPESPRWYCVDGRNVRDNSIFLHNGPMLGEYGLAPAAQSLRAEAEKSKHFEPSRHTHEWLYLSGFPDGYFNILVRLNNHTPERGRIMKPVDYQQPDHPINDVVLMDTGEKDGKRSLLLRLDGNADMSMNEIVTYLQSNNHVRIGGLTINFNDTLESTGYSDIQRIESISHLPGLEDSQVLDDAEIFKNVSSDKFTEIFKTDRRDNSRIGSKHVKLKNGGPYRPSIAWFKGYKVNIAARETEFTTEPKGLNRLGELREDSRFNDYAFSAIAVKDTSISTHKVEVVANHQYNFVVLLLILPDTPATLEEFYNRNRFKRYSFSWIKNLLKEYEKGDSRLRDEYNISYISVDEEGDIYYDGFYLWLDEASDVDITKTHTVDYVPESEWPDNIKLELRHTDRELGTEIQPDAGELTIRIPGNNFAPATYDVLHFKNNGEMEPVEFDPDATGFGMVKDLRYRKLTSDSHFNTDGLYPAAGESPFDYKDFYVFSPSWSMDTFRHHNHSSNGRRIQDNIAKRIPGFNTPSELRVPQASKLLSVPGEFRIPSPEIGMRTDGVGALVGSFDLEAHLTGYLADRWSQMGVFNNVHIDASKFPTLESFITEYVRANIIDNYTMNTGRAICFFYPAPGGGSDVSHPRFIPLGDEFDIKNDYRSVITDNGGSVINFECYKRNGTYELRVSPRSLPDDADLSLGLLPLVTRKTR